MRKKLYIFFTFILIFGVTVTGVLSYNLTKNLIMANVRHSLEVQSNLAKNYISLKNPNENYDKIANAIMRDTGNRITIIKEDGKVIGESDKPSESLDNHINRPEVQEALNSGAGTSIRYSETEKITMFYYATKFNVNGDNYIIRLSTQFNDIKNMQIHYLRLIIISITVGIIISAVLVYVYLNKLTEPIRMLTRVATTISLGQYEKRINIDTKDEIGQLGHAFNVMASRLEDTILDLSDKRNKLFSILTSMDDGVIVFDNNQRILLMNPAAQKLFLVKGDPINRHILEVIRNSALEDLIKSSREEEVEIKLGYPELKILRLKTTEVINYDKNNEKLGVLVFIQDVTKIKTLERMRSDFVANVSHELKTPLTSIKGFAETLKYVEDKPTREKFLDIIHIESERLTRLINDILTLSELENRDFSINFEKINVKDSIEEVLYIMRPVARTKNIDIEFTSNTKYEYVLGDRDKFKQMIINLVDNAVKYSNHDSRVEICISSAEKRMKIDIKDNGIGIPEKNIPRLFERFYRVDKARSRDFGGTGLGLAIVKHIVAIFKGEIEVKSKPGKGTTFTIYLPLINSDLT